MIKEFKGRENTTGKIKNCKGIKDFYKYYRKNKSKKIKKVNYKQYSNIISDCNKLISKYIIEGFEVKLLGLGRMQIVKYDREFKLERKHRWSIDWKRSKDLGYLVYHKQHYVYKWRWIKTFEEFTNKGAYTFKATRTNTRAINQKVIKDKIDYLKISI